MIGNDVIDLADDETHSQHPRFDDRVFRAEERRRIQTSEDPRGVRWALWAAKEAAYKLARRKDPRTIFSPPRFAVTLGQDGSGMVAHAGRDIPVRLQHAGDALVALASEASWSDVAWGFGALAADADPSRTLRDLVCSAVASELGQARAALRVERLGRIPRLWIGEGTDARALDLSLSHHGRYVAWACCGLGSGA